MIKVFILTILLLLFPSVYGQKYYYDIPKPSEDWETESIYKTNIKVDSLFSLIEKIQNRTYDKVHSNY